MKPSITGTKYDKIAQWWHDQHVESSYGVSQLERAIGFASNRGKALDVGCGARGRFIRILQCHGFSITGLDVSKEMVKLASENHPSIPSCIKTSALGIRQKISILSLHGTVSFICHLLCKSPY